MIHSFYVKFTDSQDMMFWYNNMTPYTNLDRTQLMSFAKNMYTWAYHSNSSLVPHICVSESDQHGSGNGLSPVRRRAITWTNASLLSIRPLGTYFSEIRIGILKFLLKKMHLKLSSAKMPAILSRERWVKETQGLYNPQKQPQILRAQYLWQDQIIVRKQKDNSYAF